MTRRQTADPARGTGPSEKIDEGEYKQYAYAFFGHADAPQDGNRWVAGQSPDGKGEFSFADPAPRLGQEPQLAPAPESAHDGLDATRSGNGRGEGMIDKVRDTMKGMTG